MNNISIWNDYKNNQEYKSVKENMNVDVLIVGGGITGLSTMYHLNKSNLSVILVERNRVGRGVTSRSTAKITFLQEKIMMKLRSLVSTKVADDYLESQIYATNLVKNIINKENIECDLENVDSYTFTQSDKNVDKIIEEYTFLKRNNVNASLVDEMPLIDIKKAVSVKNTYVFHPLKYIMGLYNILKDNIYEESLCEVIDKEGDYYIAEVNGYKIKTKYIVIASHYPYFLLPFLTPFKTRVETSFLGAKKVKLNDNFSAINIDKPSISLRMHKDKENNYLIYLSNSANSAFIKNIKDYFTIYKEKKFDYIWSNKDIITHDYLPFIGRLKKDDNTFLVGCGYNTWGMTNGSLAGDILSDIILGKENKYEELFNPLRGINGSKILSFPVNVFSTTVSILKSNRFNVNNSKVINKTIDGEKVLIYVDKDGKEHIVYNRCPHMKCGLILNEDELTWDCHCHGSRFTIDGKCIEGPSNNDISYKKK